jgi:hypothetical protein
MQLNLITLILIFTLSVFSPRAFAGQSQAVEPINIDLFNAQFNGKRITEISLDNITDWLGRPSAIRTNKEQVFGVDIYYHNNGLVFNVAHAKDDEQQYCKYISIYLSKVWDSKFSEFFLPYKEMISRNLNGSWKIAQLKAEFSDFKMRDYSNDKTLKQFESIRDIFNFDEKREHILTTSRIDLENEASHIIVVYEPNTKFLEWLNISIVYPKTQESTEQSTNPSKTTPGTKRQKSKSASPLKTR